MNRFLKAVGISLAIALVFTGCEEVLTQLKDELKPGQQTKQEELDFSLVLENIEPEARYSAVIYGTDGVAVAGAEGTPLADDGVVFAFLVLPGEYGLKVTEKAGAVKTTKTDTVVFVDGLFKVVIGWDGLLEADAAEEPVSDEEEAVTEEPEAVEETDTEDEAVAEEPEAVEETDTEEEAVAEEPEAVEETDTEEEAVAEEPVEEPSYGIELDRTGTYTFPLAIEGYAEQTPEAVTISNTGNQPTGALTVTVSWGYASAFALSAASIDNIEAGGTATFAVAPKTALPIGVHTATVTVTGANGISESFEVSFEVRPVPLFTVTFYTQGGSEVAPQFIAEGNMVVWPPAPTRLGFAFGGWHADSALITPFDFNTPVTGNLTLYARWTLAWTVTFDLNGGTLDGGIPSQIIPNGETATQPAAAPAKTDWNFDGWYTAVTEGSKWNFASAVTQNRVLYARWVPIPPWTVTLNLNGGYINAADYAIARNYVSRSGNVYTVAHNAEFRPPWVSKVGYDLFDGWFRDEALTQRETNANIEGYMDFTLTVTSNMTLYAKFTDSEGIMMY